jgi:uncharacterized protein YxjI
MPQLADLPSPVAVDLAFQDRFVVRQRLTPLANTYDVCLPGARDDEALRPFCFAHEPRLALREGIRFYADATREHEVMRVEEAGGGLDLDHPLEPGKRYDVMEPGGTRIGSFERALGHTMLRSTYRIRDATGLEIAVATEEHLAVAVLRQALRLAGLWVPLLRCVPVPYCFAFKRDTVTLGTHRRRLWKLRDVYTVDMTADPARTVDRRLVLALSVGLDALMGR